MMTTLGFWRRGGRGVLSAGVITIGLGLVTHPALAQRDTSASPVSATLLRVVAEAADGYRTGEPTYFVAEYRFPHSVRGPYKTLADARNAVTRGYGVFGPYTTPPDEQKETVRVVRVTLSVLNEKGVRTESEVKLDSAVDALFLTRAAVDKFLVPYYVRVYGPDGPRFAERLQKQITPLCHLYTSIPCTLTPSGGVQPLRIENWK